MESIEHAPLEKDAVEMYAPLGNPQKVFVTLKYLEHIENVIDMALAFMETSQEKDTEMLDNKYSFVSREEDVDYLRILRETPKNTPYVLVEEKTRHNRPVTWTLFIHKSMLNNPDVQGKKVLGHSVSPTWGISSLPDGHEAFSYRYLSGSGKFPGIVKQELEKLRRGKTGKTRLTRVTYV